MIWVSGTTGFDYVTMTIDLDPAAQADQAFRNIERALAGLGAGMADLVTVQYIVPDRAAFQAATPVLSRWLGDVRPAATMLVAGLLDPRMRIEISATAMLPAS